MLRSADSRPSRWAFRKRRGLRPTATKARCPALSRMFVALTKGRTMAAPFTIAVPDAVLADLSARLAASRLPVAIGDDDWDDGTAPLYLHELVDYWRDRFDWRVQETALNRFAQFREDVDGTAIHFVHQRGRGPAPFPILLLHGYPDS